MRTRKTITERQAKILSLLWEKTDQGRHTWSGTVFVEGLSVTRTWDILNSLRKKGAIDWRPGHNCREFKAYLGPDAFEVIPVRKLKANGPRRYETDRLADHGAFMEAVRGLPMFEDDPRVPATVPRYLKAPPNPEARTL